MVLGSLLSLLISYSRWITISIKLTSNSTYITSTYTTSTYITSTYIISTYVNFDLHHFDSHPPGYKTAKLRDKDASDTSDLHLETSDLHLEQKDLESEIFDLDLGARRVVDLDILMGYAARETKEAEKRMSLGVKICLCVVSLVVVVVIVVVVSGGGGGGGLGGVVDWEFGGFRSLGGWW